MKRFLKNPGPGLQGFFVFQFLFLLAYPDTSMSQERQTGIQFRESAVERGLVFRHISGDPQKRYIAAAKGSGVAVVDVNQDGYMDIYLVNGTEDVRIAESSHHRNQFFLNEGDGTFRDSTEETGLGDAGFGFGAFFADVDQDGDPDAYLTNFGTNQLYINDGTGRFEPTENANGAASSGMSTGAAFGDVDGDGDLDLYVANYAEFSVEKADALGTFGRFEGVLAFLGPASFAPAADHLFINQGNGTFTDESTARGINSFIKARSFSPTFFDMDRDGDLDLFVAGDTTSNLLYENDGTGNFTDVSLLVGVGFNENGNSQGCMGVAVRDGNRDGFPDLFVVNYQGETNMMYENNGDGTFSDKTIEYGLNRAGFEQVSFGNLWEDFDNDGDADLFISNGHVYPQADSVPRLEGYAQRDLFYTFNEETAFTALPSESHPFLNHASVSRGSAVADFDRDGDLDVVVSTLDGQPLFLENQTSGGNWLQIDLRLASGSPAYGAQVTVYHADGKLYMELLSSSSYNSQSSSVLHTGLGNSNHVTRVQIRWPNGETEERSNVSVNQRVRITQPES